MSRQLSMVTVGLVGLILLALLTVMTVNRLGQNRRLWQTSLTNQGAFILASLEANSRAGMRHMGQRSDQRLQYLAEDMGDVGLVSSVFLIDENGKILVDSKPERVGQVEPNADELWQEALPLFAAFTKNGFRVAKLFKPFTPFGGHPPPWMRDRHPPFELRRIEPRLGVVILATEEYQAARRAEIRQAIALGAAIFGVSLALIVALLLFHDRRLLSRLRLTTGHLIEQMPAGLISADESGRIVTANREARRMCGLGQSEEVKARLNDLLTDKQAGRISALGPDQALTELKTELIAGGQRIPVSLSAVGLQPTPEDPTAHILLIRDLREVRELERRLERSERLAALGRLSAGVAHEIRNPLSSIRGLAQYLKGRLEPDSPESEYAGVMMSEADRLDRVVSNLLAYARTKPPQKSSADLNDLARKVADLVKERAQDQGVEIELTLSDDLEPFLLDSDQITQVILNLLLNAVESGAKRVELSTGRAGKEAWLTMADDGPGVDEESRAGIFEPFFTTKAKGSGLGLAISQRIVEDHGGRLTLKESGGGEAGGGAVFELTLPMTQGEEDGPAV